VRSWEGKVDVISARSHLGRTPTVAPPCGATTPIVVANPAIFSDLNPFDFIGWHPLSNV
jgi:hypothetical protein